MNASQEPDGWTESEYKSFKVDDDTSGSEMESEDEEEPVPVNIKGYRKEKYKKILFVEELLPE